MAAPASEGLLELQDLHSGQRAAGRKSSSSQQRRPSDGDDDGEDVPATVSVRPLLADAGATGSSDSQRLFVSSSNATASRHDHPVRDSSVLRCAQTVMSTGDGEPCAGPHRPLFSHPQRLHQRLSQSTKQG